MMAHLLLSVLALTVDQLLRLHRLSWLHLSWQRTCRRSIPRLSSVLRGVLQVPHKSLLQNSMWAVEKSIPVFVAAAGSISPDSVSKMNSWSELKQ